MAIVYSPNVIEISVKMQQQGKPTANVWHMHFTQELGSDSVEDVVGDFRNNWQDHIMQAMTSNVVVEQFDWRSLDPQDSSVGIVLPDPLKNIEGQATGDTMPPNVAYLVHKNTDQRPRGRRDGRCYLPGVAEANVNPAGGLEGGVKVAIDGYLSSFYNGISDTSGGTGGDRYPCVLETTPASRAPGQTPVTLNSRRVTSLTLDELVATQRDRLR